MKNAVDSIKELKAAREAQNSMLTPVKTEVGELLEKLTQIGSDLEELNLLDKVTSDETYRTKLTGFHEVWGEGFMSDDQKEKIRTGRIASLEKKIAELDTVQNKTADQSTKLASLKKQLANANKKTA